MARTAAEIGRMERANAQIEEKSEEDEAVGLIIGGVAGLIGGALFGGIGVLAAIAAVGYFSGVAGESKKEEAKIEAKNMMMNIINQINAVIENAEKQASVIAQNEIEEITLKYTNSINERMIIIDKTISNKEKDLYNRKNNLEENKNALQEKIRAVKDILNELNSIEGEI